MSVGKIIAVTILWYPLFFTPAVVGFALYSFLTRNLSKLSKANWLTMVLPWLIWVLLTALFSAGKKSMSNVFEASLIGCVVAGLFLILGIARRITQFDYRIASNIVLFISCFTAFLVFELVPALPE